MKLKTYALLDLVGMTAAIQNGKAAQVLENFWNAADAWTNSTTHEFVEIPGTKHRASPDVFVSTFSDSALLHTGEELKIEDFFKIVRGFKHFIEERVCKSYVVISRSTEITQPLMPALGGHLIGTDYMPRYTRIAGSGEAWANLHAADKAIQKQKIWHRKYSVYAVGKQSVPPTVEPREFIEFIGLSGTACVFAIE